MTTNHAVARSEVVRKRRTQSVPQSPPQRIKKTYRPETKQVPLKLRVNGRSTQSTVKPRTTGRATQSRSAAYNPNRRHFDIAFNTSRTSIRTPGITLPTLGPRLVSGILMAVMAFALLTMWNSSTFQVSGAKVTGNQRLTEADINNALSMAGKPIFSAVPEEIKQNLIKVYPEIASVDVKFALPNQIIINLIERTPIIFWQRQDGTSEWIDAQGVKFPARGQVDNLVTVIAFGDPSTPPAATTDPTAITTGASVVFIDPSLIKTITELVAMAPAEAAITYDPGYGLGWNDPRGWSVYFGENTQNVSVKLTIYQAIIDKLSQEGVQPTMISVEYLDAPFYRTQ